MKALQTNTKYIAWLSPEVMHNDSKKWLSELEFAKDEQLFFNDLVKTYTLQLIDSKYFSKSKTIINNLSKLQKITDKLIETIKKHARDLQIMIDGIDQLEEERTYKKEHEKYASKVATFFKNYRIQKSQLFTHVKGIVKENKQKYLLNKT